MNKGLRFLTSYCLILPQACNLIEKETLAQVFSCEFCEISKNAFFTEHLPWLLLKKVPNQGVFFFLLFFSCIRTEGRFTSYLLPVSFRKRKYRTPSSNTFHRVKLVHTAVAIMEIECKFMTKSYLYGMYTFFYNKKFLQK